MFLTLKRKFLILFFSAILCLIGVCIYFLHSQQVDSPNTQLSIVIDAGHGGLDVK